MQNVFPKASVSDCWLPNRRQCIMQQHHHHNEHTFKLSFLPRCPETLLPALPWSRRRAGLVWRVNISCNTLLSKPDLSAHAVCSSMHKLMCFKGLLGFQEGPFNLKPKRGKPFFSQIAWERKKQNKTKPLGAFVFGPSSADSIKPAHQLVPADSYSSWIIKSSPSTLSSDGGQDRGPSHLSTTAAFVKEYPECCTKALIIKVQITSTILSSSVWFLRWF